MKNKEIPFIDQSEILSAEFRRLKIERKTLKTNIKASKIVKINNEEKERILNKTNGICLICGEKLSIEDFSITNSIFSDDFNENYLPACSSCKKIHDNYLPDEIKWALKIGIWAKTQIEFETDLGKSLSEAIIDEEKYRESKRKNPRNPLQLDISKFPIQENHIIKDKKNNFETIKQVLYWAYANLGMADKALNDKTEKYGRLHYVIRKKLFNGLMNGTMNPRSLFFDEKSKLEADKCCVYCGSTQNLHMDHLIPKKKGGKDCGENLVWACRTCNTSKNDTDLMVWCRKKGTFPPISILRNYLKLTIQFCIDNNLMDENIDTAGKLDLPFAIESIPLEYPNPNELIKRYYIEFDKIE